MICVESGTQKNNKHVEYHRTPTENYIHFIVGFFSFRQSIFLVVCILCSRKIADIGLGIAGTTPKDYAYLGESKLQIIAGQTEAEFYQDVRTALSRIGFSGEDEHRVYEVTRRFFSGG